MKAIYDFRLNRFHVSCLDDLSDFCLPICLSIFSTFSVAATLPTWYDAYRYAYCTISIKLYLNRYKKW